MGEKITQQFQNTGLNSKLGNLSKLVTVQANPCVDSSLNHVVCSPKPHVEVFAFPLILTFTLLAFSCAPFSLFKKIYFKLAHSLYFRQKPTAPRD